MATKKSSPLTPAQRREAQGDMALLGKPRSLRPSTQKKAALLQAPSKKGGKN